MELACAARAYPR